MKRLLVWALVLAAPVVAQDGTTTDALPTVRSVTGDLHVWRHAQDKLDAVKDAVRVAPGDRLGTRKDKFGLLVTDEGTMISLSGVEVGHERGLSLERTKGQLLIKIHKGKIVLESFQTAVRVETPNGAVEGSRAHLVVQVEGEKTKVTAVDGTFSFSNSLGTVKVEGGQESSADRTTRPSEPKRADVEKAVGEVAPIEGQNLIKNPGFEDGLTNWAAEPIDGREAIALENAGHAGGRSVRLEISNRVFGKERPTWLGFKQNLALTSGKKYLFRAYVRLETREGAVKPFCSIGAIGGPRWMVDPAEKGWRRVGGVYAVEAGGDVRHRISIEVQIETEKYDAMLWADDFMLLELK